MTAGNIERRTMSRVAWRILPFVTILYLVAFLDRVNVGFAALTMNQDIGLSSTAFGIGAGVFFIGYFLFEVPSNLIIHRVGAPIWIARIMVTWGLVSAATGFVRDAPTFYVLRFLLGIAEAGFFPGIIFYLSYWFPAHRRASVNALFMTAVQVSTALGSPISAALLGLDGLLGLRGWQWMFVLEAAPAVILGIITYFYLPRRPEQADWLPHEERGWLVTTMNAEHSARASASDHRPLAAIIDPRVLALSLVYFGTSVGVYVLSIWAPQIIKTFGASTLEIGFVSAIPPTAAAIMMVAWAHHSDRTGERVGHIVLPGLLAVAGLILAAYATTLAMVVFALVIANIGISASKPPTLAIATNFLVGSRAAAGIAAINSIGSLGGFIGPFMIGWLKDRAGGFDGGLFFTAACIAVSVVAVLALARSGRIAPAPTQCGTELREGL